MARQIIVIDDDERQDADTTLATDHVIAEAAGRLCSLPAVFLAADPPRHSRMAFVLDPDGAPVPLPADSLTLIRNSTLTKAGRPRKRPKPEPVTLPAVHLSIGQALPVLMAARKLALDEPDAAVDPSGVFWGTAGRIALTLIARGRMLPGVSPEGFDAWRIGPLDREDAERLCALAGLMPPAARAIPVSSGTEVLLPEAEPLLRAFLDAVADTLPRSPAAPIIAANDDGAFTGPAAVAIPHQRSWAAEVAAGIDIGARVSLRLEAPDDGEAEFTAVAQLQSLADPTRVSDIGAVWHRLVSGPDAEAGARTQIDVLLVLRRAARVWEPLTRLLSAPVPAGLDLTDEEVFDLLGEAAARLSAAGVDVHLPKELARSLTAQAVVSAAQRPGSDLRSYFDTGSLLDFRWQLALGGEALTEAEMDQIAEATRPLVRLRDQWVLVDETLARKARQRVMQPLTAIDALGAALTGTADTGGERVPVDVSGWLADLRARIAEPDAARTVGQPAALQATLRDYQLRGLSWLDRMASLGLGGCLADDMGLGKTITLIALHLHRQTIPDTARPTLVVCPDLAAG